VVLKNEGTHMTGGRMRGKDGLGSNYFLYYDMDGEMISRKHGEFQQKVLAKEPQNKKAITSRISSAPPALPPKLAASRAASASVLLPKPSSAVSLSEAPLEVTYKKGPQRPDDIAVIIGNADYGKQGSDIPNVTPGYANAASIKAYVTQTLGVREGNIIYLKDATAANMLKIFGSEEDHRGQLLDWTLPGVSRVFVYYAGHGAPAGDDGTAYLVPVDADAARIQLNGYPLSRLYNNLSKLPAKSVTVVLEACFSGASQGGSVLRKASPIYLRPKVPKIPPNVTLIAAGEPRQLASWEEDESYSLFTKYFLKGMSGEADTKPYGNGDGVVGYDELERYLKRTLTYYARRYYGRDQTAVIVVGQQSP